METRILLPVLATLLLFPEYTLQQTKRHRLSILSLNAFTGLEPRDNQLCKVTQQLVVDFVNNRTDILPDYFIELDFQNEGPSGNMATKQVVDYTRRLEEWNKLNKDSPLYQSPVVMGPLLTGGCKSWTRVSHHMNIVTMAASCTAPSQTARRDLYPNMYRLRASAELMVHARFYFLKRVTKWRKMAVLMNMNGNPYYYDTATVAEKAATAAGFEVVAFEASPDYNDEIMDTLERADIRVFNFESAESLAGLRFLCQAYKFNITGPRYFFVFQLITFVDPSRLALEIYPGCTRQMIMEQFKISVFVGTPFDVIDPVPNEGRNALGQTLKDFETLFDAYTNRSRTPDYDFRHMCYDRVLQTVVILNNTEQLLVGKNMSLRDHGEQPEVAMKAANESAASVDFRNLRHGRFHYSKRLEFDYEPQFVTLWSPNRGLYVTHRVTCYENASSCTDVQSYFMDTLEQLKWKLPDDGPTEIDIINEVPLNFFIAITVISWLGGSGQIGFGVHSIYGDIKNGEMAEVATKLIALAGCIFMDAAAATVAIPSSLMTRLACDFQIFLTTIGICLVNSCIGFRLALAYREYSLSLICSVRAPSAGPLRASALMQVPENFKKKWDGIAARVLPVSVTVFLCFNIITMIVSMSTDQIETSKSLIGSQNYNFEKDTLTRWWVNLNCKAHIPEISQPFLTILNALPLLVAIFATLKLRTRHGAQYCKKAKIAAIISTSLYAGTIAAVFILSGNVIAQHLTIALAMLIGSLIIATIIFFTVKADAQMAQALAAPSSAHGRTSVKPI